MPACPSLLSTLDWLKLKLVEHGYDFVFIDGSKSALDRSRAIDVGGCAREQSLERGGGGLTRCPFPLLQRFVESAPTTVFLLNMKSGGVGINLTAASHVFLLEPALNPALEAQAIGRAWRMGQQREVVVKRLYVPGSIEDRLIELVRRRRDHNPQQQQQRAAPRQRQRRAWLHPDEEEEGSDLEREGHAQLPVAVGALTEDAQNFRVAELDLLLEAPALA